MTTSRALVLREPGPATFEELSDADLPDGDVTVAVAYSSLNYKDGLAVSGEGKIARRLPMVCGIDLAGTVEASDSPHFAVGDEVVLTGWGLSETHPGGYTQHQRVRSEWLVPRPYPLSLRQAMAVGTAGLTAMLCVMALEQAGVGVADEREVLVTGAGGGVGNVAVALLAALGHRVAASTGRAELHDYLRSLGATTIVDRAELSTPGRPLAPERWAGAIDTVGSQTLATVLSQVRYGGAVAACGLAGGNDLPTTVLPFILRGISLLGVDSAQCPTSHRIAAWRRIGLELAPAVLDSMTTVEPLSRVPELAHEILAGHIRGRVVIDTSI
ncbi:MAG TPA: MDR family oxidoreductase [Acidimicrobiales bacterium]